MVTVSVFFALSHGRPQCNILMYGGQGPSAIDF
jgi:hypothetical protein